MGWGRGLMRWSCLDDCSVGEIGGGGGAEELDIEVLALGMIDGNFWESGRDVEIVCWFERIRRRGGWDAEVNGVHFRQVWKLLIR